MAVAILQPLRNRFSDLVSTMSPRDRSLFLGLLAFLVLVLLGGGWWFARSLLGDAESRVRSREQTVQELESLAAAHASALTQVSSIEEELRKNAAQDLPSFLERKATDAGIASNLQGVREKQLSTQGTLEERTYTVEISKITLEQFVSFLYKVEADGYPLKIRSTKVKAVTLQGAKLLNVSIELSAFKLVNSDDSSSKEAGSP